MDDESSSPKGSSFIVYKCFITNNGDTRNESDEKEYDDDDKGDEDISVINFNNVSWQKIMRALIVIWSQGMTLSQLSNLVEKLIHHILLILKVKTLCSRI
jgi:hypothetical protein